jgi:mRNA interferase MazF
MRPKAHLGESSREGSWLGVRSDFGPRDQEDASGLGRAPEEMKAQISTVIIAPMTSRGRDDPTRAACTFQNKSGQIVLDQLRTVDKTRLVRRLGEINAATADSVLEKLAELFAR